MQSKATPRIIKVLVDQAEGKAQGQRDAAGTSHHGCSQDQAQSTMPAVRKGQGQEGHLTGLLAYDNTQIQICYIHSGGLLASNLSLALKIALY